MFANSGSARLAYDVAGDGPDVLLIHAGVTDRRSWAPLVDVLAPTHRCVTFDARTYGDTTYRPEAFSRSADALAVLEAAGVARAAVVGSSLGGRTALDLALQHPDLVRALVLIGSAVSGAPSGGQDPPDVAELGARLEAAEAAGDRAEVNRLEARVWLDGPTAAEGRVGGPARELFLDMNRRALAAADPGTELRPVDAWSRLEEITVPTLVLVGDLDISVLQDRSRVIAERIPDARFVRLPGVAHLPQLEADPACLAVIVDFLGGPAAAE